MKYCIFLSALLCSCSPYLHYSEDKQLSDSVLITVECKNEKQVETAAIQALKFVRFNDLEKETNGQSLVIIIKVRYKVLLDYQAKQIKEDLQHIQGVWDIQVIKDGLPVKNSY